MTEDIEDIVEDEEKAEKLSELIEKKVEEKVETAITQMQEEKEVEKKTEEIDTQEDEEVSRRSFLKKLGAGAAGLGAMSLLPNAAAYDIRSSDGLEVWGGGTKYFEAKTNPVKVLNADLDLSNDLSTTGGTTIWDSTNSYIPQGRLQNDSVTVAGNNVSLGGSTSINHVDLSNISSSDHHAKYTDSEARSAVEAGNLSHISGQNNHKISFDANTSWIGFYTGSRNQSSNRADIVTNRVYFGSNTTWVDGSHNSLTGISSNDHHSRYTDSEARSAIEAGNVNHVQFSNIEDVSDGQIGRDNSIGFLGNWGGNGTAVLWDAYNVNTGSNISVSGGMGQEDNPQISVSPQGSGSGLNADTVDGKDASEMGGESQPGFMTTTITGNSFTDHSESFTHTLSTTAYRKGTGIFNMSAGIHVDFSASGCSMEASIKTSGNTIARGATNSGSDLSTSYQGVISSVSHLTVRVSMNGCNSAGATHDLSYTIKEHIN